MINASTVGATDLILATPAMLASQGLGVAKKKVKKKKKAAGADE